MIRHATGLDLDAVTELEACCFPESEAASRSSLRERIAAFPDCFWLLEENGQLIACIDGMATDEADLRDEMYEKASLHRKDGSWQMLFSVMSHPDVRLTGCASRLMEQVILDCRARGRKGIVLTCKETLLPFYARFGYVNEGISCSTHGGAVWYRMRLTL